MAIIVEEEKNKIGFGALFAWLVTLAVIGFIVYYIFFQKPESIELVPPSSLKDAVQLSKIDLNPEDILDNPQFKSLKQYIPLPQSGNAGRSNPFLGF